MNIELEGHSSKLNRLDEFKDGAIGIIRNWDTKNSQWIGSIVTLRRGVLWLLSDVFSGNNTIAHRLLSWQELLRLDEGLYIETLPQGTRLNLYI